jgi:hypothetical protein
MVQNVRFRWLVLAAAVVLPAWDAAAITLGRARGAVLVGRPLDLAIPVTLESANSEVPCVDGDVFYGDQRVTGRLNVRWEPGPDRQGVLHVNMAALVDEPMVTIYLRVGCQQRMTRRYVLLAELPPEQEPAVPLVTGPRAGVPGAPLPQGRAIAQARAVDELRRGVASVPMRTPGAAPSPGGSAAPAAALPPAEAAVAVAQPSARERRAAARRDAVAVRPARPPAATRPRLKLEPLELMAERDPTLRLSTELQVPPNPDPKARQWAAALWQALSKAPEEAAQESQRLRAIEAEMKSLRSLTQQNAAAVTLMTEQVEKARRERNEVAMVALGLLVLLALAGAALWWFWMRGRQEARNRWFASEDTGLSDLTPAVAASGTERGPGTGPKEPVLSASSPGSSPLAPARQDPLRTAPIAAPVEVSEMFPTIDRSARVEQADFQTSQDGSIRMVRVDELIDIQDKANFFLSIGQHDQAIAVLEGHVHDQVDTSALAWLDLLDLYHSLDRRAEFTRLRGEFRQQFNAHVPEFDEFDIPSGGLEDYGRALSRIVALWPSPRVLEVIEESIFRKPGVAGADAFSLEAYRELILLYNIAREVIPMDDDTITSRRDDTLTDFSHTTLESLSSLDSNTMAAKDHLLKPPASPRLGLDIDLDAPTMPLRPRSRSEIPDNAPTQSAELEPLDFDTSWDNLGSPTPPPKPDS